MVPYEKVVVTARQQLRIDPLRLSNSIYIQFKAAGDAVKTYSLKFDLVEMD